MCVTRWVERVVSITCKTRIARTICQERDPAAALAAWAAAASTPPKRAPAHPDRRSLFGLAANRIRLSLHSSSAQIRHHRSLAPPQHLQRVPAAGRDMIGVGRRIQTRRLRLRLRLRLRHLRLRLRHLRLRLRLRLVERHRRG